MDEAYAQPEERLLVLVWLFLPPPPPRSTKNRSEQNNEIKIQSQLQIFSKDSCQVLFRLGIVLIIQGGLASEVKRILIAVLTYACYFFP